MATPAEHVDLTRMRPEDCARRRIHLEGRDYLLLDRVEQGADAVAYPGLVLASGEVRDVIRVFTDQAGALAELRARHGRFVAARTAPPIGVFAAPGAIVGVQRFTGRVTFAATADERAKVEAAEARFAAGDHDAARALGDEALAINPHLLAARDLHARLAIARGDHEAALRHMNAAILADPVGLDWRIKAAGSAAVAGHSLRALAELTWIEDHYAACHAMDDLYLLLLCEVGRGDAARRELAVRRELMPRLGELEDSVRAAPGHGDDRWRRVAAADVAADDWDGRLDLALARREVGQLDAARAGLQAVVEATFAAIRERGDRTRPGEMQRLCVALANLGVTSLLQARPDAAMLEFDVAAGVILDSAGLRGVDVPGYAVAYSQQAAEERPPEILLAMIERAVASVDEVPADAARLFAEYAAGA